MKHHTYIVCTRKSIARKVFATHTHTKANTRESHYKQQHNIHNAHAKTTTRQRRYFSEHQNTQQMQSSRMEEAGRLHRVPLFQQSTDCFSSSAWSTTHCSAVAAAAAMRPPTGSTAAAVDNRRWDGAASAASGTTGLWRRPADGRRHVDPDWTFDACRRRTSIESRMRSASATGSRDHHQERGRNQCEQKRG